jgi:23S rRNA (guanine745-N1)-methyltransferase
VDAVLSVFSPRNATEFARVLHPGGCVITATPGPDHLAELRGTFGLLGVQQDKGRRLADAYGAAGLRPDTQAEVAVTTSWTEDDAVRSIMMGPNAFHTSVEEVRAAAEALVWPHPVTLSCVISRWSR